MGKKNKYEILINASQQPKEEYFSVLIKMLNEKEPWIRLNVVLSLNQLGDERAVSHLIKLLREEKNEFVKAALIKTLGKLGNKKVLPVILPFLDDSDSRVVANTVESIEIIGDRSVLPRLIPLLDRKSIRVRVNVAKALWRFGHREALDILFDMLNNDIPNVRDSVIYALGEINTPKTREKLCNHLLKETEEVLKFKIVKTLGKIGDEYCIPALRSMLSERSIRLAEEIQIAISNIQERRGEYKVCKECGSINATDANYCSGCGTKIQNFGL